MLSSGSTYSDLGDVKQVAFTKSAAVRLFCILVLSFPAFSPARKNSFVRIRLILTFVLPCDNLHVDSALY